MKNQKGFQGTKGTKKTSYLLFYLKGIKIKSYWKKKKKKFSSFDFIIKIDFFSTKNSIYFLWFWFSDVSFNIWDDHLLCCEKIKEWYIEKESNDIFDWILDLIGYPIIGLQNNKIQLCHLIYHWLIWFSQISFSNSLSFLF